MARFTGEQDETLLLETADNDILNRKVGNLQQIISFSNNQKVRGLGIEKIGKNQEDSGITHNTDDRPRHLAHSIKTDTNSFFTSTLEFLSFPGFPPRIPPDEPSADPPPDDPAVADNNNTLSEATDISLMNPLIGQVDEGDRDDFYRLSIEESGVLTASLSDLSGDADIRLIHDKNSNGQIDQGEIIAWQWERGSDDESIRQFVETGDYLLQVFSYNDSNAQYSLTTNFVASERDPLAFDIQLNLGIGLEGLNDSAKTALQQAVAFWEDAITHSSFATAQTLDVTIAGLNLGRERGTLAYVPGIQPTQLLTTEGNPNVLEEGDRLLPIDGEIVLNRAFFDTYNQDPDYLEAVVRHEMGHVLGIGTLWFYNDGLINRRDSTYSADTYAGAVYGEMLGTFENTAVPIEPEINGHWDETVFDDELLTPRAERLGASMPLSNLTLASLRDLGWNVNFGAAEPFELNSSLT